MFDHEPVVVAPLMGWGEIVGPVVGPVAVQMVDDQVVRIALDANSGR